MSGKALAHIRTVTDATVKPKIKVPDSDSAYFYTGGRMMTYFPEVNGWGMTFFREDCKPILGTLRGALANIEHIKPGNDIDDPLHLQNATIGSIYEVHEDEDGIDVVCKNDRDLVHNMGFKEEDFTNGKFNKFSQESDFTLDQTSWIVVDAKDKSKVVQEVPYLEGLARGYKRSRIDPATGQWNYYRVGGNPVYARIRPSAFAGIGHVETPADRTGQVYTYAAAMNGEKLLAGILPGMDAADGDVMEQPLYSHTTDFLNHPDLVTGEVKDYASEDNSDKPENHFAAVHQDDTGKKQKLLRIKDDKGDLHRGRLIAAYHSLSGTRGNTAIGRNLPPAVADHAMRLVRQGLDTTKKTPGRKSMSSLETNLTPDLDREVQQLKEAQKSLATQLDTKGQAVVAAEQERDEAKKALATLQGDTVTTVDSLKNELKTATETIEALKTELKEHSDKALASERLTKLEAILPFNEDEKKEEAGFPEFQKSLASMTDDRFELQIVRRELAKERAESAQRSKSLASLGSMTTAPERKVEPVGRFDGLKTLEISDLTDVV